MYAEYDWWTGKPMALIVAQRQMVDNYKTARLFGRPVPRFPRGMDRAYAARHLRDARYWMREAVQARKAWKNGG